MPTPLDRMPALIAIAKHGGARFPDADPHALAVIWHRLLGHWPERDIEAGIYAALTAGPWIDAAAIAERVKIIRADRLDRFGERPAPNVDPDDARAYAAELAAMRDAIADGAFRREHVADYIASGRSIAAKRTGAAITPPPAPVVDPAAAIEGRRIGAGLGIGAQP